MMDSSFLGRGWAFPVCFHSSGVVMSSADKDIAESLRILISTHPGERIMNPHYGCDLREFMFRSLNASMIVQLKDRISRAILFFEPRVSVEKINVAEHDESVGCLRIEIVYVVNSTNTRHNLVFPFYLLEATDVMA